MQTEVILKSKIESLGAEADIVRVRPGYARNYLFPRGLAVPATAGQKHLIETLRKARAAREASELNDANQLASRLNKMTITFQMLSGSSSEEEKQKLFGSVTATDIVDRLSKEGVVLEKKKLKLAGPIKDLGEHKIEVALHMDVTASFKVVLALPKSQEGDAPSEVDAKGRAPRKPMRRKTSEA